MRRELDSQAGQTLPLIAMFMLAMIGMLGLVIDAGGMYQQRQQMQASTDAAALAAAAQVPSGSAGVSQAAQQMYALNTPGSTDTVSVAESTSSGGQTTDTVTVTATRQAPTYFLAAFGYKSVRLTTSSTATIYAQSDLTSSISVMPWGVMQSNFTYGDSKSLMDDSPASGNFGALSIPTGDACSTSGANSYRDTISGASKACPLSIGDQVDTKTGKMSGPTQQGLDTLLSGNTDSVSDVVEQNADGTVTILKQSPRLVAVPIITNTDGSTAWPNGKKAVTITGFAYFFITGYDGSSVTGQFIQASSVSAGSQESPYTASSGITTVALTG